MVIANPMYDVVFKNLMENERVAKFFIGTLLGETIESVEVKPQEFTYTDGPRGLAILRLDFIAVIKTASGELTKVLIEIQKAKNQIDLMRFRNYLAEQYKKEDTINDQKTVLPITTIYILGFYLEGVESACIKVERNYKDLINRKVITAKSDFIEKLTHDSFIVQVERITDRYQTKLDKLLSVFEQTNFIDDNKIIKEFNHSADIEEVKLITDILHYTGTDPTEKKKIEVEQEAWRTIYALTRDAREKLDEQLKLNQAIEKELEEKGKELEEKGKELEEKGKELEETGKKLKEKDKVLEEMEKQLEELKRKLGEK